MAAADDGCRCHDRCRMTPGFQIIFVKKGLFRVQCPGDGTNRPLHCVKLSLWRKVR